MSLVFLIGMPGVGKTFWGRKWSAASDFQFMDLDSLIERKAEMSIPQIFRDLGEEGFRTLETAALAETIAVVEAKNAIIATGGGTPVFNNNINLMLNAGLVLYLKADIDTLLQQIAASDVQRPLLQQSALGASVLEDLQRRRAPFYDRAHMTLSVETLRTDTFAQILKECTDRQL